MDMKEMFLAAVRHGLTFVGGYMVAKGFIDEVTMADMIAVGVTVVGFVWSLYEKYSR